MTEQEFYNNIEEWIKYDLERWNHITMLAYFCWKYEKKHQVKFRLVKSKKGVESSKESADFAKLFKTFAPENYTDLDKDMKSVVRTRTNLKIKNYINWVFDYKYRNTDKSINGTRLFLVHSLINEFERMYVKHLDKQKNQFSFEMFSSWCKDNANDIFNILELKSKDDLKYLKRYIEQYELSEHTIEMVVFKKAQEFKLI